MIGTKGTQWGKLSLSSLHLEVRLQKCCEQVFYVTNISNMFLSPHIERIRQNKKQSMFIHVKTATHYRRGFTVISSLSITSTSKLKLLILSHDVIFMVKYRNYLEIYYYCTTSPETNISDVDSFLISHVIRPWQLCKVYMPVFTYWAEKTGKELHFISSASLQ